MKYPLLPELVNLVESTIVRRGTTTAAGAATGDSITDVALAGAGADSFVDMMAIVYPGEHLNVDSFDITAFNNATGEITLNHAYKEVAAAMPAGVDYIITTHKFAADEIAALAVTLGQVFDIVNAMLTLQETGGVLTASAAEQYLYVNNSPLGEFRPLTVLINLDPMVATEQIVVKEYYRITATGDLELLDVMTYDGVDGGLADGRKLIAVDMEPNRYGAAVTLAQPAFSGFYKKFVWDVHVKE
ncbi:MAG TPA: hypothetical protein VMW00_06290 [Dehalococcoidales bacterium]|nr:hypothetical protein [Dehalococcoidales bacterium]